MPLEWQISKGKTKNRVYDLSYRKKVNKANEFVSNADVIDQSIFEALILNTNTKFPLKHPKYIFPKIKHT